MNKKIILLLIVLVGICAVSHASAVNETEIISQSDLDQIEEATLDGEIYRVDEPATYEFNSDSSSVSDIQSTIENTAKDGDTIILTGTFKFHTLEEIIVRKSLTIKGSAEGATFKSDDTQSVSFFTIDAPNVVLSNIKFVNAHYGQWGIYWLGDNGNISACVFDSCSKCDFAALYLKGKDCNITNCIFSNNDGKKKGGAIFVDGKNARISNSTFKNNQLPAPEENIQGGGAIYSNAEALIIEDCKFIANAVKGGSGGAIYISGNGRNNKIINCEFKENSVSNYGKNGGAIYSKGESLKVNNCTFNENQANENGGAIYLDASSGIYNSSFEGNSAVTGNAIYCNSDIILEIMSNYFVVDTKDVKDKAVYGKTVSDLERSGNIFKVLKDDSKVIFLMSMIFEYGSSGQIHVKVEGGTIENGNISVVGHPEAKIDFSNNILTVSNLAVGKYTLRVTTTPDEDHFSVTEELSVTVKKATAVIKASKITVALKKGTHWSVKIVNSKTGKAIANMKLTLKVYTGKKYKSVSLKTNSKGVASYQTKYLAKGKHKVVVSAKHAGYNFNTLTSYIKVIKQTSLKFDVARQTFKDGASLSIIVKNKKTKKAINGVKVKLLIYTGSKLTKTVILKTLTHEKHKGVVGYATNELSVGKHVVKIKPVNIKYSGLAKSSLKITKSAKKHMGVTTRISAKV